MRAVIYDPQARANLRLADVDEPVAAESEAERLTGTRKSLETFAVRAPFGPDLGYLVELLAAGAIDPQIGLRTSWDEVSEAAEALLGRGSPARRYWTCIDDQ